MDKQKTEQEIVNAAAMLLGRYSFAFGGRYIPAEVAAHSDVADASALPAEDVPTAEVVASPEPIAASATAHDASAAPALLDDALEHLFSGGGERSAGVDPTWRRAATVADLHTCIRGCVKCALGSTRKNFVFGVGNPSADIMVIGEAPGADEDEQGEPFVGKAGQLLNKILEAIRLHRSEVYIANIIKCRPPGNRRPLDSEVAQCEPYLFRQIELVQPKFILALGLTAVDTLLKKKHRMSEVRGTAIPYRGAQMIATYHPAALLRNEHWKRDTWEDVKLLRRLYDAYLEQRQ